MSVVRHKYMVLLLLALLFMAPGIVAYFFYQHPQWLQAASTNKGTLLNPPVRLLRDAIDATKWQLILWNPSSCEDRCVAELDKLARIRLALGRHLYEVQLRLLLDKQAPSLSLATKALLDEQGIQVSTGASKAMPDRPQIFIANPEGYLVLSFQLGTKPNDVFHDIKQLLTTAPKVRK